jgi:YD repeat-containing protein
MQVTQPAQPRRGQSSARGTAVMMVATSSIDAQRRRSPWISVFSALVASVLFVLAGCGGASSDADQNASDTSMQAKRASASATTERAAIVTSPAAITAGDMVQTSYSENGKLMRADENLATLGNDLFGEQVNLYDGATQFVQTDVALPGNSALPVSVGRRLTTGNSHLVTGLFGDWDLEIPHLQGVFANTTGWKVGDGLPSATTARCTQFGPPPQVRGQNNQGLFNPVEYWHGSFLHVPGQGAQEILQANTSTAAVNPTGTWAAGTPKLTTKNRWTLVCNTPTQNSQGEGFTAVSPDGTKYRFDWLVSRPYPQIGKPLDTPPQLTAGNAASKTASAQIAVPTQNLFAGYLLKRQEVWILPTLVTDRFDNKVAYAYDTAKPWRLNSITSTESSGVARTINFQYSTDVNYPNLVSSVTDGTRTWSYGYADHYIGGIRYDGKKLASVTLPTGGGAWTIDMGTVSNPREDGVGGEGTCDAMPQSGLQSGTGTMTHPSGAIGTFKFASVTHGRSYVPQNCMGMDAWGTGWSYYPLYSRTYALQSKTLSGPGLPAVNLSLPNPGGYTWLYSYGPANASWSTCVGCAETTTVTVTDPQSVQTVHTFGNRFQATEGQLQRVDEGWNGTTGVRTTTRQYAAPTNGPYPNPIGYSVQARTAGDLSTKHAPESQRSIIQQGVTFTWQANTAKFDRLARPTEVTKSSTLGYSRTEQTVYADLPTPTGAADTRFTDPWVLGEVSAVNRLSGPGGAFQEEIEGHNFDYTKLKPSTNRSFGRTVQTLTYLGDGNLGSRADGLGQTTSFSNYKRGIAQDVTYADTSTEHADVNNLGLITAVRNAFGTTTTYAYNTLADNTGRLTAITPPPEPGMPYYGTTLDFVQVNSLEAGLPAGHWRQTVTTNAAVTVRYFDALWRPVLKQTRDTGVAADTSSAVLKRFDGNNRLTFESYAKRNSEIASVAATPLGTRRFYDEIDRTIRVEQDSELGVLPTQTNYLNGFGRSVTNPRGFTTTTWFQAYDAPSEDLPITIQMPAQLPGQPLDLVTVGIGREPFYGKPTSITRAGASASVTRRYVYDSYYRLCKTIEPESGSTVQSLDAADNLTWRASGVNLPSSTSCDQGAAPAARKINFTYTARNWLKDTSYGDGTPGITRT